MKAPITWFLEYTDIVCDTDAAVHELASEMTLSGTKVESIDKQGAEIEHVVIGRCLSVAPHTNSDHLQVCQVSVGRALGEENTILQIVTGAPNVREDAYIPIALHGSTIAGGVKIKNGKLRGVESCGMMCSFEELGLHVGDYPGGVEDGILILQDLEDFKCYTETELSHFLGKDAMSVLGANHTVIDFEVTSNRADCFSMLGLAREAAVTMHRSFHAPSISLKEESPLPAAELLTVEIQAPDLCPRYAARVVTNVKIAPSPKWMRDRLQASGIRPINNIVDITNYVMLEYGQPMHAFDKRTIHQDRILVRRALDGEAIRTLDGQERTMDQTMLVIADGKGPLAIAGVMGGENSEIEPDTTTIVFESAVFDAVTVRKGAKKVGLRTEASSRFEKGLDVITCLDALNRAAQLVEELEAGTVCQGVVDCYPVPKPQRKIPFCVERINAFLGIQASQAEMESILSALSCRFDRKDGTVLPPSFRDDLVCEADIAEEVARFYGYNNIPSRLLTGCETTLGHRNQRQRFRNRIRSGLVGLGYCEMLTFSFQSPSVLDNMRLPQESPLRDVLIIRNPLGEDFSVMRTSMLPSLLESLSNNHAHRIPAARLFEISYVYRKRSDDPDDLPEHRELVSFGCYGDSDTFFDLKGDVEALLRLCKVNGVVWEPEKEDPSMHPGRTAKLLLGNREIGFLGQIHPKTAKNFDCPENTYVAILELAPLAESAVDIPQNQELPKFPAVSRDLAVVLDKTVPAGHVEKMIRERGGKLLEDCRFFDCYEGAQVPDGKKSLAYSLSFRDPQKTLTDDEVNKCMKKILHGLETGLGAELR